VGQILDALLGFVAAIDADTGVGVGDGVALRVGILGHVFSPSLPVERADAPPVQRKRFRRIKF
jgi:hypothetical protein